MNAPAPVTPVEDAPAPKRTALFWIVILVVVLLGCGLFVRTSQALYLRLRPPPEVIVPPAKVEAVVVTPQPFEHIVPTSGSLEPIRSVDVFPKLGGKVVEVRAQLGDRVEEGDILARVETPEYSLQSQQADVGALMAGEAVALAERSLGRLDRVREEAGTLGLSQQAYEEAQIQVEGARTQRDVADLNRALMRQVVSNGTMRAPCDGEVTKVLAREGAMVGNEYPAFHIDDTSRLFVNTHVDALSLPRIAVGQRVQLVPEGMPDTLVEGTVTAVATSLDPWTRRGPVEITIEEPPEGIIGNLFARGEIITKVDDNALVLPLELVLRDGDKARVQVARDGFVVDIPVVITGERDGQLALTGVPIGALVIVPGAEHLMEGEAVEIVAMEGASSHVAE